MVDVLLGPKALYVGQFATNALATAGVQALRLDTNGNGTGNPREGMFYLNTVQARLNTWNPNLIPAAWAPLSPAAGWGELFVDAGDCPGGLAPLNAIGPCAGGYKRIDNNNLPAGTVQGGIFGGSSINPAFGNITINPSLPGGYKVQAHLSCAVLTAGVHAVFMALRVNGARDPKMTCRACFQNVNVCQTIEFSGLLQCVGGEVLECWVTSNNAINLGIQAFNFNVVPVYISGV